MSIFGKARVDQGPAVPAPAPSPPPAAPAKVDQALVDMIGAEPKAKKRGRLGSAAFDYYRSLGDGRTFVQVARQFGVTESAVARFAGRHSWLKRIHLEDPVRAAEVSREVQIRVRQKAGDLMSVDPAGDAERARRVRNELLATGLELLELGKAHLATVPIEDAKSVLAAIKLGADLMQAATVTDADRSTADVVLLMRQKLQALTEPAAPAKIQVVEKENTDGNS